MAFDPETADLAALVNWTGQAEPGSNVHTRGTAELVRRQILTQIQAAEAEVRAADAATIAAQIAERNTRYVFWSVIAAAVSAIASLMSTLVAVYSLLPHK